MNELRAFFVDPTTETVIQIAPDDSRFAAKVGAQALALVTVWRTGCVDDFVLDNDESIGNVMVLIDDEALAKHTALPWTLPAPTYPSGSYTFHGPAVVVLEGNLGVNAEDTYGFASNVKRSIGW